MSQGIQITIPDFDDDDNIRSLPTPFGRTVFGFGGYGGDSPSATTPLGGVSDRPDRSYFSHNRGDSNTSVDSTHSATRRYVSKPFAHSSQSSITTPTSAFSKKPSFASIRNAFKSGKNSNDAPPVPQVEQQTYPILKNPFNRSTSSLNRAGAGLSRVDTSFTPTPRPPTPASGEGKGTRGTFKSKHSYSKSQHSHSGSIFLTSDAGSDNGLPSSPPPVPRVPSAFGNVYRSDSPPMGDSEDDKVSMDPKTPSDYALHAVFIRFATTSEEKIEKFLLLPLSQEPFLPAYMGPGVDTKFDETLNSLGKIAHKHAKPVIDSIMRWRRSQHENVGSSIIKPHLAQLSGSSRSPRAIDVPNLLNERKSLASIYIMCRALISLLQSTSRDALGEVLGYSLEETTFDQFRRPDLKLLAQSHNHRTNADLYATLLGHIANVRFISVTDRFLNELGPIALGQVSKDLDMKYENLVRGLKHIQIKVWPPEAFEEGAEFLESLSKSFGQAHGQRLKIAFAETLNGLLHPIGKTAQAETNNPQWAKAIEIVYPKARDMMSKPRYWFAAFPLTITSLCVAPQNFFLKHWISCFETSVSKLKEKPYRVVVMNGILRLVWTYLYRCQEAPSTTITKLENLMKHFFPPNKLVVLPQDDSLQPLIHILHFILCRHFECGRDMCLELMQESSINALQKSGNIGSALAPERTVIAVQAGLLTFHAVEKDILIPSWPSSSDYTIPIPVNDYPTSSAFRSTSMLAKPGMQDFYDRCSALLATIAIFCSNAVGHMSFFDEQWLYVKINPAFEESHSFVTKRHAEGIVVSYPVHFVPHITLLHNCFSGWPRYLHPSIAHAEAVDMLLRGLIHVEPTLNMVAGTALTQFMDESAHALLVVSRFTSFMFGPNRINQESQGLRLFVEVPRLVSLWVDIVEIWIQSIMKCGAESITDNDAKTLFMRLNEIEAAALFLILHEASAVHSAGVKIVRILGRLISHITIQVPRISGDLRDSLHITERLHGKDFSRTYLYGYDDLLESTELSRLEQMRKVKKDEVMLFFAESGKDRKLWRYVFPAFIQTCMEKPSPSLAIFRDSVVAVTSKYHSMMSQLAGLSSKVPSNGINRNMTTSEKEGLNQLKEKKSLIDQWYIWVKVLCATAVLPEISRAAFTNIGREHSGAQSDSTFERERLSSTRGLFRYLTPFLDSEYTLFRDAAVLCISSFPSDAYPQLLEDLSSLASRQFYDDARSKSVTTQNFEVGLRQTSEDGKTRTGPMALQTSRSRRQERLHSAVARIYYLTAHFLPEQRSLGRQAALAHVLKFVRNTQAFLGAPEMRDNWTLQRLRRYFCGTVERLFDGMATLKDSDRFIPLQTHLALYRLCEEWCQLGPQSDVIQKRQLYMQGVAEAQTDATFSLERYYHETSLLSNAAVGALCSLCAKAIYPSNISPHSPTDRPPAEFLMKLTLTSVLERLEAFLSSDHVLTHTRGRKALQSLLISEDIDGNFTKEVLLKAIVITTSANPLNSCSGRFFKVIADIVADEVHKFTFSEVVCLGLSNLRHPFAGVRRLAFNMLEAIHHQSFGLLTMSTFEAIVGSSAPATFIHAHRLISDFLAGEHPHQALGMLKEIALWLSQLVPEIASTNVVILLLQSLEFWIPNITITIDDRSNISNEGITALHYLMSLALHLGLSHAEQILVIWTKLVEAPHQENGHAAIKFLLKHCANVGSTVFRCASNIVSCLCQTQIGHRIFEDLCSMIEPSRMSNEHKLSIRSSEDTTLWSKINKSFLNEANLNLYPAQIAWLLLSDVSWQRYWENKIQLPILLHVIVTHLDYRTQFVRHRAQSMLFQLLRAWIPGYDELPDRSANRGRSALKDALAQFEKDAEEMFCKEDDDDGAEAESKMRWLCSNLLKFLEPLAPSLANQWGSLALSWGTACPIRSVAFRSLQIFRAIMPRIKQGDFALLLGRLSNTISASEEDMRLFTREIISTIKAAVTMSDNDLSLLSQTFWSTCACLSTCVESDFFQALQLLNSLLNKVDLDDCATADFILSRKPMDWTGTPYVQPALLKGLRSSTTFGITMDILRRLAKFQDDRFIDASGSRLRDLYTVSLPWCLHAMDQQDNSMAEFAGDIGALAESEGRSSIHRIMSSFAKGHFRTRDDFLRQSVGSLREHYGAQNWTDIVTLLIGLVLNPERWLRTQSLQILKVLFQQRETRSPLELLGSELLMPLLRLLETDLASQAIDVLEEPISMTGGIAAKQVLRMSMHAPTLPDIRDRETVTAVVFGVPEESGWCIAQADVVREICRANIMAVFDTCSMPSRPSRIDFEPEIEALALMTSPFEDDLGGLVKDLHDLTSFFQESESTNNNEPPLLPNRRLEARVAAILAKSTAAEAIPDMPQTPFLDVFRISGAETSDESDNLTDSDSGDDVFAFDNLSPGSHRAPNGFRYH